MQVRYGQSRPCCVDVNTSAGIYTIVIAANNQEEMAIHWQEQDADTAVVIQTSNI